MATYCSMIFAYSHIHHIYVYNIYSLYHIYVYRHTDYFKNFNIINNTAINSPVHKYLCIFHCFLQVNPHIYFSSPSLQFLVIINHWLKITGVFPFYCFPCSHFPKLPFLSAPTPMSSKDLRVSAFSGHLTSLFLLAFFTALTRIPHLVWSGLTAGTSLTCPDCPVSNLFSGKSMSLELFIQPPSFKGVRKNFWAQCQ